jgi:hypothetical protein
VNATPGTLARVASSFSNAECRLRKQAFCMGKVCMRCGIEKSETEFPLNRYGSKVYRRNTCQECYAALRKNHEGDDKPDGLTCKKCGEYQLITGFPRQRQCLYGVEPDRGSASMESSLSAKPARDSADANMSGYTPNAQETQT